jgi:hypothetical protein
MLIAGPALAQAPVPGWAIGRPEGSTLAPHAPRLTVTPLDQVPVAALRLPPGFHAEVYAHGIPGVRAIAEGPNGTLFAGSRGIGRSICEQMAAHGAKVVVSSRKLPACEEVVKSIKARGGEATAVALQIE